MTGAARPMKWRLNSRPAFSAVLHSNLGDLVWFVGPMNWCRGRAVDLSGRHPDLVDGAVDGLASGDSEHHLDQVEAQPGGRGTWHWNRRSRGSSRGIGAIVGRRRHDQVQIGRGPVSLARPVRLGQERRPDHDQTQTDFIRARPRRSLRSSDARFFRRRRRVFGSLTDRRSATPVWQQVDIVRSGRHIHDMRRIVVSVLAMALVFAGLAAGPAESASLPKRGDHSAKVLKLERALHKNHVIEEKARQPHFWEVNDESSAEVPEGRAPEADRQGRRPNLEQAVHAKTKGRRVFARARRPFCRGAQAGKSAPQESRIEEEAREPHL